jgi:hypothetical protein
MKFENRNEPLGPDAPLGEILLAETAIRIELPPSLHQLAVDRYEAVRRHIERFESPLRLKVRLFYPQGSMAIKATIKSRKRVDGYDIDIVAELILPASMRPDEVLSLLFDAINGQLGSKYHGKVERQSRCVTVFYEDGMHLDVTPTLLIDEFDPRRSHLFHAKPEEPAILHRRILMNSYAFCEWFKTRTPIDLDFATAYAVREFAFDSARLLAKAEAVPVPSHSTVEGGKSATVVALQLLKRNRNLRYETRKGRRMPPSVMMAKIAAEAFVPGASISGALAVIVDALIKTLEAAEFLGVPVDVRNPMCQDEHFTDRWPEDRQAQRTYIDDLKFFRTQLAGIMSHDLMLDQKRDLLVRMFGEGPAQSTVDEYVSKLGRAVETGNRVVGRSGSITLSAVAEQALSSPARAVSPKHTFFGTRWKKS